MKTQDSNNYTESNGVQFQGFVSLSVLPVTPALIFEPIRFQVGLRIKNNTPTPVCINLFNTLSCTILSENNSVTPCHHVCTQLCQASERDFSAILPGETLLHLYPAQLSLFVDGGTGRWMTRWWRRFLKLVNPQLAYLSVRWETERTLGLSILPGDGKLGCELVKPGVHQILFTYRNQRSSSEFYDRATKTTRVVENLWVGSVTNIPPVPIDISRSS